MDDSTIYRSQIKLALDLMDDIEVVGSSSNGSRAIDTLKSDHIDLIILDLEMPIMDGLATLKEINHLGIKVKTIVFSSLSVKGAELTMKALSEGASDFVAKPSSRSLLKESPQKIIFDLLESRIKSLFTAKSKSIVNRSGSFNKHTSVHLDLFRPKIIVIGSSTGGPSTIETIFSQLTPPINCPIVITQHMPPIFTKTFAERIEKISGIKSCEAVNNDLLESNQIYVAPGDYHLTLVQRGSQIYTKLDKKPKIHSVRPAVDYLFTTASDIFKESCLGIVLTGMGCDGASGAVQVKKNDGVVIIQDQASCVVYGMPKAVEDTDCHDLSLNIFELTNFIREKVRTVL